jgi:hypothetical protein
LSAPLGVGRSGERTLESGQILVKCRPKMVESGSDHGGRRPQRRVHVVYRILVKYWSNTGQILVKYWSNTGQNSNCGQVLVEMVEHWSHTGKNVVQDGSKHGGRVNAGIFYGEHGHTVVRG